jgi:RNA recognition motif-containing protein
MSDYKTITVQEEGYKHYYFVKQHFSKEESQKEIAERTLFVANLPVGVTIELLRKVFTPCGVVESGEMILRSYLIWFS